MQFRCWAEIDLQALRENLAWLRHRVGPQARIITVVKADAYGHGLKPIARQLMQSGTDIFGVANLTEAEAVRSVGRGWPVLMLGACLPNEVEVAVRDEVMPTISSLAEARLFSRVAQRQRRIVAAHVKVDTGMGRLGSQPHEAVDLVRRIMRLPAIELRGLYTHYASSEDDAAFSAAQAAKFRQVLEGLAQAEVHVPLVHANNSGGVLLEEKTTYSATRPGLLVYGVVPSGRRRVPPALSRLLRPALAWKCRVSLVRDLPCGATVSYGHTFRASHLLRVAVVTAGYGDGYPRAASGRAFVLIGGRRCPVLGRVTMDQMIVDVSAVPRVRSGDEAVLIGRQGRQCIGAVELAGWAGSIPWEVLTSISHRVRRVYLGGSAA